MKKYMGYLVAFVIICYLWFAVLPQWFNFSFPTGSWDWLGFVGTVGSVFFALYGIQTQIEANHKTILKQQQLSVVPCLDIDAYTIFTPSASNNSFRVFKEQDGKIINDGYTILRTKDKEFPTGFSPKANFKVQNKGLSTAFQVVVYIYQLETVDGLETLNDIDKETILDFYDKIHYKNFEFYENMGEKQVEKKTDWIISPQYNLTCDKEEFNLVFDLSNVNLKYHTILKFEYEDIYENRYHQLMYFYFDKNSCQVLPVSKIYNI